MRVLVFLVIVLACSSTAVACGWEMVCGDQRLGISKGCCDNEGKLFVHINGREICVTRTRADLVLRIFSTDVLVPCGVVLFSSVSLFAMRRRVFGGARGILVRWQQRFKGWGG